LRVGLVSEVVPRDRLWDRAHEIAAGIAARRPEAVQGTVRAIWEALDMSRTMALQNGLAYTHIGNPGPGDAPVGYALGRDVEVR
jgi:enoyl-CoA hydratase/carnithine racemase